MDTTQIFSVALEKAHMWLRLFCCWDVRRASHVNWVLPVSVAQRPRSGHALGITLYISLLYGWFGLLCLVWIGFVVWFGWLVFVLPPAKCCHWRAKKQNEISHLADMALAWWTSRSGDLFLFLHHFTTCSGGPVAVTSSGNQPPVQANNIIQPYKALHHG